MATLAKDMRALIKRAEQQGWRVTSSRGNSKKNQHLLWYAPDGKTIITSGSTESGRPANHLARLKATGQFIL